MICEVGLVARQLHWPSCILKTSTLSSYSWVRQPLPSWFMVRSKHLIVLGLILKN